MNRENENIYLWRVYRNGTPKLCQRQSCCPSIISGLAEVDRRRLNVFFRKHRCLAKLRRLCSTIETLLQFSFGFYDTSISSFAPCFYRHVLRKAPTPLLNDRSFYLSLKFGHCHLTLISYLQFLYSLYNKFNIQSVSAVQLLHLYLHLCLTASVV